LDAKEAPEKKEAEEVLEAVTRKAQEKKAAKAKAASEAAESKEAESKEAQEKKGDQEASEAAQTKEAQEKKYAEEDSQATAERLLKEELQVEDKKALVQALKEAEAKYKYCNEQHQACKDAEYAARMESMQAALDACHKHTEDMINAKVKQAKEARTRSLEKDQATLKDLQEKIRAVEAKMSEGELEWNRRQDLYIKNMNEACEKEKQAIKDRAEQNYQAWEKEQDHCQSEYVKDPETLKPKPLNQNPKPYTSDPKP
jgi:hypothetical protein